VGAIIAAILWNVFFYKKTKIEGKRKSEYISAAAHELRTPITAIKWYLDEILKGGFGPIKSDLKTPLEGTATVTENLIDMVNNMLNVSRLEEGRLTTSLSVFDLGEVVSDVVPILAPLAKQSGIALTHSVPRDLYVRADKQKTREIVINLVGNALKFTSKGTIQVSAKVEGDTVKIFVADTGRGIKEEDKAKLFHKYQQVGEQQQRTGTGLGLFISREMARKMNGDVWLERSDPAKGSTFAFSLPRAEKSAQPTPQKSKKQPNGKSQGVEAHTP
jgi:signal transduction histidine kinase